MRSTFSSMRPRSEKLRRLRLMGHSDKEAEELVDTVDRDRIEFVKHYFGADWPTRCLYHMMINTAVGDEVVISTVLDTMRLLEKPVTRRSGRSRSLKSARNSLVILGCTFFVAL